VANGLSDLVGLMADNYTVEALITCHYSNNLLAET